MTAGLQLGSDAEGRMAIATLEDYQRAMQAAFVPERARGKRAILQYVFSGSVSGACYAVVEDGTLQVAGGTHPSPTATVETDFDLWLEVVAYHIDGLMAYQEGRFRVIGNIETLMEADTWFAR
jgi:putative sterol carrier protein